jgi:phage terminase large subunit-like protein
LASLPQGKRQAFLKSLTTTEAEALAHSWDFWARDNQLAPPGDWRTWLVMAGRGFGKTRTGAEWVRNEVESGRRKRIALIGATAADVRDVMVEGESGLLACSPRSFMPRYEPSKRRISWPNGAIAMTFSADEPERLRGPQHDGAWCDEPASWRYPASWDMLQFGLRLGDDPRSVVTGTPKPVKLIRDLIASPNTVVTRGKTYENRANLARPFFESIVKKYEGTRLGRQELNAELLDDNPYALWQRNKIEELRVTKAPELVRIVVGIDPQVADPTVTLDEDSAETGIVVAGITAGTDPHAYILDDASCRDTPNRWGLAALTAYNKFNADRIIAEVNNGGAMVEFVIGTVARDAKQRVPYKAVHASRGKVTRAEPVAALYEQGKVHHVGCFPELEDQMCEWMPGEKSPDRMDALVWALTELIVTVRGEKKKSARGRTGSWA